MSNSKIQLAKYNVLTDEDEKIDFLYHLNEHLSNEFLNHLINILLHTDEDEFVKAEILKSIVDNAINREIAKDGIIKFILQCKDDEMALSIAVDQLILFDLNVDDLTHLCNLLLTDEYQEQDLENLTSSILSILCSHKEKIAQYLEQLKTINKYKDSINAWGR